MFIEILIALSKPITFYLCPKCKASIEANSAKCNNCKVRLDWPKIEKDKKKQLI